MPRMTKQKQTLYQELRNAKTFFDVNELHRRAAQKDTRIGIATIYRFLKALEEKGEIHSYLCEDRKIYSLSEKNHVHFCCESCGTIRHLDLKKADFLRVAGGEEICHFQVNITGLCSTCRQK